MAYVTNYIRVVGKNQHAKDGPLFFFNDNDLGERETALAEARELAGRVGGKMASYDDLGEDDVETVGYVREPLDVKAEASA